MDLDQTDKAILAILQRNGRATAEELGERLNLSPSQAGRRRQRLEVEGVIDHYAARLDPRRIGLAVEAFVQVELATHGAETAAGVAAMIADRSEIVGAWTMTGRADYLLRVWTADLAGLNRLIHQVILAHPAVARVESQIAMDRLKADAPLPV